MKFAIIGTNFVSDNFMAATKYIEDFELVAVCSAHYEEAEKFANKYGAKHIFTDYKEMADANLVDCVYIATPNVFHHDHTIYFLNKKVHVLCEKPMASNIKEVREMYEVAHKNNVMLMEAVVPLPTLNFKAIQESITKVGPVRRALLSFGKYSSRYDAYREGTVLNAFKNELSNGSSMDIGIYSLYTAIALFGKPLKINASCYMLESGVDGLGTMLFTYADKEVIVMHSKITDSYFDSEIQGEDGTVIVKGISLPQKVTIQPRKGEAIDMTANQYPEAMYYEIIEFMNCVKSGKYESSIVPEQLVYDVHETLTEVRKQINLVFPADKK